MKEFFIDKKKYIKVCTCSPDGKLVFYDRNNKRR